MQRLNLKNNYTLLFFIFIVAFALRFYNFTAIPFTHDELSALSRTQFDNFQDLINDGIKFDGHPSGVQLFLFFWVKIVGFNEWLIKLPFALLGVGSVILFYFIGKKWYNETVGLIAAAFLATLQYPVFYSQMARPYASGLFFTLAVFYFWSNLILTPEKKFNRSLVGFIIFATLSAYNHYFSLLFCLIVGIVGLFLIQKKYYWRYILSGVIIFCLFIPHISITFAHLKLKGIGDWLAKPSPAFLLNYFSYLFHHSKWVLVITSLTIIFGIIFHSKEKFLARDFLIFLTLFLTPIIVGYLYSHSVDSVLQYSVLLFSFPYLLFLLFGFIKEQKFLVSSILIFIILITNILTLIYERKYYEYGYQSIYEKIITDYPVEKEDVTLFVVYNIPKIQNFYQNRYQVNQKNIINLCNFSSPSTVDSIISEKSKNYPFLYLGAISSIPPNIIPIIQTYYPKIVIKNNYFLGETAIFSKSESERDNSFLFSQLINNKGDSDWENINKSHYIRNDSLTLKSYQIGPEDEWNCYYSFILKDIKAAKNDFIDIIVDFTADPLPKAIEMVSSVQNKDKVIFWSSTPLEQNVNQQVDSCIGYRTYHSIKLTDISSINKNSKVEIYLWNRKKETCNIQNIKLYLRKGNPYLYGIYENIETVN